MRARPSSRFDRQVLVVAVFAAAVRLFRLDAPSLWDDEIEQVVAGGSPLDAIRAAAVHSGASPLDYLVVNAVSHLSHSELVLRLPAALFGIASVFLAARLGRRLFRSATVGLAAAALLAVSPFHVRYSQEARFYSLSVFLILASSEALAIAFTRDRPRDWALSWFLLSLSFYAHVYTLLLAVAVVLAAWLSTLVHRGSGRRLLRMLGVTGGACLAFVPWIAYSRGGVPETFFFVWPSLAEVLAVLVDPFPISSPVRGLARFLALPVLPLLALLGAAGAIARQKGAFASLLPAVLVPVGVLGVLAIDWRFDYFFSARQILFVLPFYLMLVAGGLVLVAGRTLRVLGISTQRSSRAAVAIGVLVIGLSLGPSTWNVTHVERVDWRRLALFLRSALDARSAILTDPESTDLDTFVLFYQPSLRGAFVPLSRLSFPASEVNGESWAADGLERFWVVSRPGRSSVARPSPFLRELDVPVAHGIRLRYFGAADEATLATELSRLDLLSRQLFLDLVLRRFGPELEHAVRFARTNASEVEDLSRREKCDFFTKAGRSPLESGRNDSALAALSEAVTLGPGDVEALNNLGLAQVRAGLCAEAERTLLRSARLHPDSFWAQQLLAEAYGCVGHDSTAADARRRSRELEDAKEAEREGQNVEAAEREGTER